MFLDANIIVRPGTRHVEFNHSVQKDAQGIAVMLSWSFDDGRTVSVVMSSQEWTTLKSDVTRRVEVLQAEQVSEGS